MIASVLNKVYFHDPASFFFLSLSLSFSHMVTAGYKTGLTIIFCYAEFVSTVKLNSLDYRYIKNDEYRNLARVCKVKRIA